MQLIAVDIGNSAMKAAIIAAPEPDLLLPDGALHTQVVQHPDELELHPEPAHWWVCSVHRSQADGLAAWVRDHRPGDVFHNISEQDVPLETNVTNRGQVGRDRLVAAFAALTSARNRGHVGPVIVVDAGTAVTVDLVDESNQFQGGQIFPGATTILKSLSDSTDALPDLSGEAFAMLTGDLQSDFVGKSTQEAIVRGVYQMQVAGILRAVSKMDDDQNASVFACGRGIEKIKHALPDSWNFDRNLVLNGCLQVARHFFTNPSNAR